MWSLRSTGLERRYRRRPAHSCRGRRWVSRARSGSDDLHCICETARFPTGRPPARVARARAAVACYSERVGRLDNIIARNRRKGRMNERVTTSLVLGAIVLLILALAVFTDLGLPPEARDARDVRDARGA